MRAWSCDPRRSLHATHQHGVQIGVAHRGVPKLRLAFRNQSIPFLLGLRGAGNAPEAASSCVLHFLLVFGYLSLRVLDVLLEPLHVGRVAGTLLGW